MNALGAGAGLAIDRLRGPRAMIGLGIALVAVTIATALERRLSQAAAPDRALSGVVFGIVLPLLAYATVTQITGARRLDEAAWDLARWGESRRWGVAGLLTVAGAWLGVCGAFLACAAVVVARPIADPAIGRDLAACAWIGLLGGIGYATLLCLASTLGKHGGGRLAALLLDWILGSGSGFLAVPWPRGHLRNLLGSEPILHMSQGAALAAVAVLALGSAAAAVWRVPD